ncbi:MAG: hypothetical protein ABL869_03785 [Candidatus Nitrotoga sp.]
MTCISNTPGIAKTPAFFSIPGLFELKNGTAETAICRPANPEASKEEIRIGSSLCIDHLCGCK